MSLTGRDDSIALHFGKLVHLGIELLNQDISLSNTIERLVTQATGTPVGNLIDTERRSLAHLKLLISRYAENYSNDPLKTTQLEQKHTMLLGYSPFGRSIYWRGTIDGIKGDRIIERKTTSYLDSRFLDRINPNDQVTGYVTLAQDLLKNPTLNTVVFDVISTGGYGRSKDAQTTRPERWLINTNPSKLFLRCETYRTPEQLAEWKSNVLRDADRIAEDIERGEFSANQPDACTVFNTTCPFIDLCRANPQSRDVLIHNTLRTDPWPGISLNELPSVPPKQTEIATATPRLDNPE